MSIDQWLLPDGIGEILPAQAQGVEQLRRRLLDLYARWGYEMIMPPLLEFTESLLSGVGADLSLMTLKVTDQLSGRLMGLRADITPQAARIDAHSHVRNGVSRLCYADHIFHAKPKTPLAVRTPLQAGVELFGEAGLDADLEVISLLLASLEEIDITDVTLDLGHVGVFRALIDYAGITKTQRTALLELLQQKDVVDIQKWVSEHITDEDCAGWFNELAELRGGLEMLEHAEKQLEGAPDEVFAAIDELRATAELINTRYPNVNVYMDLSELRGYQYHTGIVFAAYAEGVADALANGGRYDHIGESFGRARPATGFGLNLTAVLPLLTLPTPAAGIYAPASPDPAQWQRISELRQQGERVVCGLSDQVPDFSELGCDRQLVLVDEQYQLIAI